MKKKVLVLIMIISTLSPLFINLEKSTIVQINDGNSEISTSRSSLQPKIAPFDEKIIDNVIRDSGFEEKDENNYPVNFGFSEAPFLNQELDYNVDVHSGSYSALLQAQGSWSTYGYSAAYQGGFSSPTTDLANNFILDLWYKILNNPDPALGTELYVQLYINDGGSSKSMNYILSTYQVLSNYTNDVYFDLDSTWNVWHQLYRNVTADYEAFFGPVGVAYIQYFYLYIRSHPTATSAAEIIFDDVSLTSSSSGNIITDGNFEAGGTAWGTAVLSPGEISITDEGVDGTRAVNITMANQFIDKSSDYGQSYVEKNFGYPEGYYATAPNEAILKFDWRYYDAADGGYGQQAYMDLRLRSQTGYKYMRIYLGNGDDEFYYSNSSNYCYIQPEGFGTRNVWNHFEIDIYDILQYFGSTDYAIYRVYFYVNMGYELNSCTILLVDNFELYTYPLADPGFEQDWYSGRLFASWYTGFSSAYVSKSSDAHSGLYAVNVSAYGGSGDTNLYRNTLFYTLKEGVYTDFWWKLGKITDEYAAAYISFRFSTGQYLYYYFGKGDNYYHNNNSYEAVYFADNVNQTGSWNNFRRDMYNDVVSVFGVQTWNITGTYIYAIDGIGGDVSLLLDDLHFTDGLAPAINSVTLQNSPTYNQPAIINIDADDTLSGIRSVTIFYDIGSGWEYVNATFTGTVYSGTIPFAPFGTSVDFYVTALDNAGNFITDDNGGSFYNYIIGDNDPPVISFVAPINGSTVSGNVLLEINTYDIGSDIDVVEYYDGLTQLGTANVAPYEYLWDTRLASNGAHTISARAYDKAGNYKTTAEVLLIVTDNDLTPPLLSDVTLIPSEPQYGETVLIVVTATDESSVDFIDIFWRGGKTSFGSWTHSQMSKPYPGPTYQVGVPAYTWNTVVQYYIVAYDIYSQQSTIGSESAPMSYIVGDNILPEIEVDGPSTANSINQEVTFTLSGTDLGSNVAEVGLLIDDELVFSEESSPQEIVINTKDYDNGEHIFVFYVEDGAGNIAEKTFTYTIENKFGQAAAPIFQNYGILWGIALAGVVYGGTMLTLHILRKKGKIGGK